jgi:AcrR family transcriptional regulator
MGHREQLLAGAKRCLYEKGYARTTARDIVAASGTNLASIGYHYGSKEALLNEALMSATEDFGDSLDAVIGDPDPGADPYERFEAIWTQVIALFAEHRPLWVATFEGAVQVDHAPEIQAWFSRVQPLAHEELSRLWFATPEGEPVPSEAKRVGAFLQTILIGLMAQYVLDAQLAPSAKDLTEALRTIVG